MRSRRWNSTYLQHVEFNWFVVRKTNKMFGKLLLGLANYGVDLVLVCHIQLIRVLVCEQPGLMSVKKDKNFNINLSNKILQSYYFF